MNWVEERRLNDNITAIKQMVMSLQAQVNDLQRQISTLKGGQEEGK